MKDQEVSTTILGLDQLLAQMTSFTPAIHDELVLGMNDATILLQSYIVASKLSGDPLHRRSGDLSNATQQDVISDADSVTGRVSNNMSYAIVHEEGGTFEVPEHMVRYDRARMKAWGYNVSKMTKDMVVEVLVRRHTATYPQRAFMKPSYAEKHEEIVQILRASVLAGLQDAGGSGGE